MKLENYSVKLKSVMEVESTPLFEMSKDLNGLHKKLSDKFSRVLNSRNERLIEKEREKIQNELNEKKNDNNFKGLHKEYFTPSHSSSAWQQLPLTPIKADEVGDLFVQKRTPSHSSSAWQQLPLTPIKADEVGDLFVQKRKNVETSLRMRFPLRILEFELENSSSLSIFFLEIKLEPTQTLYIPINLNNNFSDSFIRIELSKINGVELKDNKFENYFYDPKFEKVYRLTESFKTFTEKLQMSEEKEVMNMINERDFSPFKTIFHAVKGSEEKIKINKFIKRTFKDKTGDNSSTRRRSQRPSSKDKNRVTRSRSRSNSRSRSGDNSHNQKNRLQSPYSNNLLASQGYGYSETSPQPTSVQQKTSQLPPIVQQQGVQSQSGQKNTSQLPPIVQPQPLTHLEILPKNFKHEYSLNTEANLKAYKKERKIPRGGRKTKKQKKTKKK